MAPKAEPTQILGAMIFIMLQTTAFLIWCEYVEASELKTITPKDVPKTIWVRASSGNPNHLKMKKKEGIIMTPPPIPKSPAKKPEKIPSKI